MSFNPAFIEQARSEIRSAPYGHRSDTARKWAGLIGVTFQHLYRLINNGSKRARKSTLQKPGYQEWAKIIFTIKKRPPEEAGEISTEDALSIAVKAGQIPEDALNVPVSTFNAIARKNGWAKTSIRANRFQAEKPNEAHHFDASTSKFFYIAKKIETKMDSGLRTAGMTDGGARKINTPLHPSQEGTDYVLKIHRPAKHYKNKPIPVDALRPWIYGLVDDHSGRFISRYTVAQGENSADSMNFLAWAWAEFGLPEKLLADQGMLKKALPSRDLIDRLGIELPEMMPYQKRGHGKIERPWRTCWKKFELPYFAAGDWKKFEISLSELNSHLMNFINEKYNQLAHRFEKNITRLQAWNRVNLNGGIVQIPENALQTVARRAKRKIGVDGLISYNGVAYQVKELYDAWVYVYEGVFPSTSSGQAQLIVQDIETGKKYEVRDFKPLALGEFRSHAETPHEELIRAGALALPLQSTGLYAEKANTPLHPSREGTQKILSIPIRTKENREIEDPFNVDSFASLQEAMGELYSIVGIRIDPDQKEVIEKAIVEHGMDKAFVTDLALEIRASVERQRMAM
jgi:hypothetical protein